MSEVVAKRYRLFALASVLLALSLQTELPADDSTTHAVEGTRIPSEEDAVAAWKKAGVHVISQDVMSKPTATTLEENTHALCR